MEGSTLGERLAWLRRHRRLRLREVADATQISMVHLSSRSPRADGERAGQVGVLPRFGGQVVGTRADGAVGCGEVGAV